MTAKTSVLCRDWLFVLVTLAMVICGAPASAQLPMTTQSSASEAPVDVAALNSKEAVREMVSRLSDDSVRQLLIERLDAVATERAKVEANTRSALDVLKEGFVNQWMSAKDALQRSPSIPGMLGNLGDRIGEALKPGGVSLWFIVIMGALLAGIIVERLVVRFFRRRKQELIDSYATTLTGILRILYTRLSFDIIGVLAFWATTAVVVSNYYEEQSMGWRLATGVTSAVFAAWLGYVICRFYFAPKRPELRICKTSDERAMRLTVTYSLLAGFIVGMHHAFYLLFAMADAHFGGWQWLAPIAWYMNISLYAVASAVIWYNREGLTEVLTENKKRVMSVIGNEVDEGHSWFALQWPKVAMTLIITKYFLVEIVVNSTDVAVYSTNAVYITFIVIFLWPGVDANVSLFVGKGISAGKDETAAVAKARRGMQQGLLRVGRVAVVGLVLYILAWLWGVNVLQLAEVGLGAQAAGGLVELLLTGLMAYVLLELVSIGIGWWLAQEGGHPDDHQEEPGGGDGGGVGLSRVATLLPIIGRTAQFLIVGIAIIMVLQHWGINIGPILAGAGVVGLAIGFGAQTLVKDIVSGLFFLADDAFRVGEYIDVGGTMGTVEKISLRSLRLRHHRGLVHTIPYGEIPKLTNFSRDWVIMKLRFKVPFESDVNKIKKIFKQIGADLLADPELGQDFLQPFKSQGVAEVDDNGIVVRGKFMAKPGRQFMIRKEVYVRVQKAFEEAGIPFARKQVMVHIPGLDNASELGPDDVKAISAAAADNADEPDKPGPDKPGPARSAPA